MGLPKKQPDKSQNSSSVAGCQKIAYVVKGIIERDIITGDHDESLSRYQDLLSKAAIHDATLEHQILPIASTPQKKATAVRMKAVDFIHLFNQYLAAKGKSEQGYYYDTRQMLKRWGSFTLDDVPQRLNAEPVSNKTFNDRRNCLFKFFEGCVRKGKIKDNPLIDVSTKKRIKAIDQRRPFTDSEAIAIIEALHSDAYSKQGNYPHSQYWRFVAFLLHTGTRNGEAIGLRVKEVDFEKGEIRIAYALSRTRKGSNVSARILKGTKMGYVRYLPLDDYLQALLKPLCEGREGNGFVFVNRNGNPIDDKMFQRRVFRPLLAQLKIDKRDLYACRHTFATRAVRQGMKPHEVAYIMGDSVEVVLQNYFHNHQRPDQLPCAIKPM